MLKKQRQAHIVSHIITLLWGTLPSLRRFSRPPLIVLQAVCWWVRELCLCLAPRRQTLLATSRFSPSVLPYLLFPLSCILLE